MSNLTLSTPLIEANIPTQYPRTLTRFLEGKKMLEDGVNEGKIFNVRFTQAKDWIKSGFNAAAVAALDAIRADRHAEGREYDWATDGEISELIDVSTARVLKALNTVKQTPNIVRYTGIVNEVTSILNAFKAAKPLIIKGRIPSDNPAVVDISNTGTCAVCMSPYKLKAGKLGHHGFRISNSEGYLGFRAGTCWGVGYLPFEISTEGTVRFVQVIRNSITAAEEKLAGLQAGHVTSLKVSTYATENGRRVPSTKVLTEVDSLEFQRELSNMKYRIERDIKQMTLDIEHFEKLIQNWVAKPLPGTSA